MDISALKKSSILMGMNFFVYLILTTKVLYTVHRGIVLQPLTTKKEIKFLRSKEMEKIFLWVAKFAKNTFISMIGQFSKGIIYERGEGFAV